MSLARQQEFLLALLFDAELRERFAADRAATLAAAGLAGDPLFERVPLYGLELDARMRRGYLMSALCRPYPIAAAAVGSMPGGAKRLARFLAARAVRGAVGERTRAFGSYLGGLLEENEAGVAEEAIILIRAFLDLERGRAETAAALRQSVEDGREPPRLTTPSNNAIKRGRLALPPYFVAAELPVPTSVMGAALHQTTPETCWSLIESGTLAIERVVSVARAQEIPVTVLARALSGGRGLERAGAGGVSPVVDVSHRTVELTGRRGDLLGAFDGKHAIGEMPAPLATLARSLLEAGLLELV